MAAYEEIEATVQVVNKFQGNLWAAEYGLRRWTWWPGTANCDFVIFPPRWMVAERTFRPPWFHRNVMSELIGLIKGVYDAKAEGFVPGGVSIQNCMLAHGPDHASYQKAVEADLKPHHIDGTLAFMWESRYVFRPTAFAMQTPQLQNDYDEAWDGLRQEFEPRP
ncbi:MAG: homogentisate 1,2-dioxygenase [Candidatus Protistobacter heckmanni]|nr:homogentisate 1,2-dioxygenase [Candidatus Protistobacter heckmanni]